MSTVRYTHPFPVDNKVNLFGDYKELVFTATRETDDGPITTLR